MIMFRGVLTAALLSAGLLLTVPAIGRAAAVNLLYDLDLNGMSTGTCPGGLCGQVSITGDTTTSLVYGITLASGVSFHALHNGNSGTGDFFYFQLTDPGGPAITFSGLGTNGNIDATHSYSYNTPTTSGGPFAPNAGNFPGTYNYVVTCTNNTSGKICNGPLGIHGERSNCGQSLYYWCAAWPRAFSDGSNCFRGRSLGFGRLWPKFPVHAGPVLWVQHSISTLRAGRR